MGKVSVSNYKSARNDEWAHWTDENIARMLKNLFEAKKGMTIYHIISRGNRWGLIREGRKRMYRIYDDKQAAVEHAKKLAQKNSKWQVVVHKKDASTEKLILPDNAC